MVVPIRLGVVVASLLWADAAVSDPTQMDWSDLRVGRPESCEDFLKTYLENPDCAAQIMLSQLMQNRLMQCAPGSSVVDGLTVRIAGFAHPFELGFKGVKSFLLIPRTGSTCRHAPPPLPDQVIKVSFADGLDINADPVWVTGRLHVRQVQTHLAPASYELVADGVEPALIPDVSLGR